VSNFFLILPPFYSAKWKRLEPHFCVVLCASLTILGEREKLDPVLAFFFFQVACYFHHKYKSGKSRTYKEDGKKEIPIIQFSKTRSQFIQLACPSYLLGNVVWVGGLINFLVIDCDSSSAFCSLAEFVSICACSARLTFVYEICVIFGQMDTQTLPIDSLYFL
jgi:hypothetical protein